VDTESIRAGVLILMNYNQMLWMSGFG
jgi:hypothetical protein